MAIDVNRGVVSRLQRETGVRVYMYYDKPGYYFDEHEHNLPDEFAASAGFPVDQHAKERFKAEKMAEFNKQVDASLLAADEAIEKEVIAEKGGYKVLAMAYGTAIVVDSDGKKVTPLPVAKQLAMGLLDALVPSMPKAMKAPAAKAK